MRSIPITFVLVVFMTLLVTIFFGAWAVSADRGAKGPAIAYGVPGTGLSSIGSGDSSRLSGAASSVDGDGPSSADSWWGSALLKACPFH